MQTFSIPADSLNNLAATQQNMWLRNCVAYGADADFKQSDDTQSN